MYPESCHFLSFKFSDYKLFYLNVASEAIYTNTNLNET